MVWDQRVLFFCLVLIENLLVVRHVFFTYESLIMLGNTTTVCDVTRR